MISESYDPVRVAFVGVGNWSRVLARTLKTSRKLELVTCFDRSVEARRSFSQAFQCREAETYEEILGGKDIEAVIVVAPDTFHADLTEAAADAGKHVFSEKPIANSIANGIRMMRACERAHVVLCVGHLQRRSGAIRKMKAMLDRGDLGQAIQAEANFGVSTGLNLTRESWRFSAENFGPGCMMGNGIHQADNLQYLLGPVSRVSAFCKNLVITAKIFDVGGGMLEFENGAVGYLGSNYAAPPYWTLSVLGTGGNLHLDLRLTRKNREEYLRSLERTDDVATLTFHKVEDEPQTLSFEKGNNILLELEDFADCIRFDRQPIVGAKEGLAALAVILAIHQSASENRIVEIQEILQGDPPAVHG